MRYLVLFLLCGCSYVHKFGQIGPIEYHKVNLGSIFGAGQTMIVTFNTNTCELREQPPAAGNGIIPAAAIAGGALGAGYFIGQQKNNVTVRQGGGTVNANPVINVPDPEPAPPLPAPSGIGPPFGSKQNFPRNHSWSK